MAIKDWVIDVEKESQAISKKGFGLILILASDKDHDYTIYEELKDVAEDFDESSEVYKIANRIKGQSPKPEEFAVLGIDNETGEAEDLVGLLNNTDDEFYFLVCDDNSKDTVEALAEWTESQQKMYGFSTDDKELAKSIEDKKYERTFFVVHEEPETYPCEGWIGRCAPEDAGSITWNFKEVSGISTSGFKSKEVKELNGNTYIEQHGQRHMYDGRTASGEWIDVIRSQDYLYSRIDESIFSTLLNANKVPYENRGIGLIETAIETPIKRAANNGMIAEEDGEYLYSVSAPKRKDTTSEDRKKRVLPNIVAELEIAGAVHGGKMTIAIKS